MTLLLGFLPLVVFVVLVRLSVSLALWIAFSVAFTLGIRNFVETGVLRHLDVTFTLLFGLLAIYAGFIHPGMSISWVGLVLELVLLVVALWSLLARRPLAGQYVHAEVPPEHWATPLVGRTTYALTLAWMVAFAVMAAADAATIFIHTISASLMAVVGLAALAGALTFTWQSSVTLGRRLGHTPH